MGVLMQTVGKFATFGMIISALFFQKSMAQTAPNYTTSIVSKTITAEKSGTLRVNSMYASQKIDVGAREKIDISVIRDVLEEFKADEKRILSEHKVRISQSPEGVTVYTGVEEAAAQRWKSAYYIGCRSGMATVNH